VRRIALYLGVEPYGGGLFQHSLNVLTAVAALPRDRFSPVAVYANPHWIPHLDGLDLEQAHAPLGIWRNKYFKRLSCVLPLRAWQAASPLCMAASRTLARLQPDLAVFPAQDPWTFQVPVPALGWVHDLMHRYERQFPEVGAGREWARRENHFARICAASRALVVDSDLGKRQVMESYGTHAEKIHVLPYVPPGYVTRSDGGEAEITTDLPERYLFYPAQFWEHKNHLRLLRALALARRGHPDMALVLAGSRKNGYDAARALVDELGLGEAVRFLGYVPDAAMPGLYRRATALVMPTFFGPTNIPPLEAQALGCPVAVSRIYAMPEQLGDAALYFDPRSVEDMAAAMSRLWGDADLRRGLAARGQARTAAWTQEHFNARFAEIMSAVLGQ
jgi:glycosyltransferase involved in cell wall biosynthesis